MKGAPSIRPEDLTPRFRPSYMLWSMPDTFDAARAVRFEIERGSVHAHGDARVAIVPVDAFDAIAASSAADAVAASIGSAIGKRVATRLGDVRGATIEAVTTQLAGELAVAGYGALSLERWGRALVLVVEGSALPGAMLERVVASALAAASGSKEIACATLGRDASTARLLVASSGAADRVRQWIASGVAWGDVLTRLHTDAQRGGDS
jgi:hypothetical protein